MKISHVAAGPLLIGAAGMLWGTDAIFRYRISDTVDPTLMVFAEHLLGVVALLVWVLAMDRPRMFRLSRREWSAAVFVGAFSSAIATALFTASFRYVNPSVAVLLQKLQPVQVVVVSYFVLGEKPARKFYFWAVLALAAGVILSFPDLRFNLHEEGRANHAKGIFFAFSAAMLWGFGTIGGKILLERASAGLATFWRYVFGLLTLTLMLLITREPVNWSVVAQGNVVGPILYISFIAGILPMAIYYAGLSRTRANITTFVELLFPISSVILNTIVLHMPLNGMQVVAGSALLFAVTMISL